MRLRTLVLAVVAVAATLFVPTSSATGAQALYPILPLGDSITYGVGNDFDSYREDLWVRLRNVGLQPNFVGICPTPDLTWKCPQPGNLGDNNHSGHSGWRVDEIARRIEPIMEWYQPRTVLLLAGANDIGQNFDLPNLGERIRSLVADILRLRPGTHVFVGTLTQFRDQRPIVRQVNDDIIANLNAMNQPQYVHIVPLHIVGDEPAKELADGVHPNECGYLRIAFVWYYYMAPVFSPGGNWPMDRNPFYATTGPCA
jgi:lysophospholipase L1-like esterase